MNRCRHNWELSFVGVTDDDLDENRGGEQFCMKCGSTKPATYEQRRDEVWNRQGHEQTGEDLKVPT